MAAAPALAPAVSYPAQEARHPRWWMLPAAAAGIALLLFSWFPFRWRIAHGVNDFMNLYSGARLIGTPGQYDPASYERVQSEAAGYYSASWLYTRLPAFAIPLRPLGRMPYQLAYTIWQMLSIAALAGFLLLWQARDKALLALTCCWSFPMSAVFAGGQDDNFLLLWLALALRIADRLPVVAGAILALGGMKFHLFLLVPMALLAGRRWRILLGFSACACIELVLCFAAAGPHWISEYLRTVLNPIVNPNADKMPNLHGLFSGVPFSLPLEVLVSFLVAGGVWWIASRGGFATGLAAAIVGSILVSHHAYNADLVLLIPALAILCAAFPVRQIRLLAMALLLPIWFILPIPRVALLAPVPLLMLALLVAHALSVPRRMTSHPAPHGSVEKARGDGRSGDRTLGGMGDKE